MNRLIEELATVCRQHVLAEKRLVAPSLRAGRQWLDSVTRAGGPVLNARATTIKGMALDLITAHTPGKSLSLVSNLQGTIIVDRILGRLRAGSPGYLTSLRPSMTLSESVHSSVCDLREAGLDEDSIHAEQFELRKKGEEIAAIIRLFREELEQRRLVDYAAALDMATRYVTAARVPDDVFILIPDDLDCSAMERRFLEAIPSDRLIRLRTDEPECLPEDHDPHTNRDLLRWVLRPAQAPEAQPRDGSVAIFRAVGEVNEIREVFRRCLVKGTPLDEVELLHTDSQLYVPLVYEVASRLGLGCAGEDRPLVTFAEGIPSSFSRPGRALAGWVSWVRDGFPQTTLVRLLEDGLIATDHTDGQEPSHRSLARTLKSVGIGFGRERYLDKLDEHVAGLEEQAQSAIPSLDENDDDSDEAKERARIETRLKAAHSLRALVADLLAAAQSPDADLAQILRSGAHFVEHAARKADELDNYANLALLAAMRAMEECVADGSDPVSLEGWDWLARLPRNTRIMGSGPRPGALHVSSVYNGGHSLRPHTFIVGLDDSRFPGAGLQHPVVLDRERSEISSNLPTAAEQLSRKLERFGRLLSRLRGTVTMSWSCQELVDDQDVFPSSVILNAYRIVSGVRDGDYGSLLNWLSPPASFCPADADTCLDMTEWWLRQALATDKAPPSKEFFARHFPHLGRGDTAATMRQTSDFTTYDGRISDAEDNLDPTNPSGPVLSASRLETLGRCPLAYFFKHVLDLTPPEERAVNLELWLDALQFGTLMHDVFYEFVAERRTGPWPPVGNRDLSALHALIMTKAEEYRQHYPPPTQQAFLQQLDQLRAAGEIFLRVESRRTNHVPEYLEASIGLGPHGRGTDLDLGRAQKLPLPDGRVIRVRARLDRIDRLVTGDGKRYSVCDYKSGSASRYEHDDPLRQGRTIQHALYMAMAETRLRQVVDPDALVEAFVYFFPGVRDHGLRLAFRREDLFGWETLIERLCDIAATGSFLPTNDEADCGHCDYRPICGDVAAVAESSRRKLENPRNTLLQPMKDMRSRE